METMVFFMLEHSASKGLPLERIKKMLRHMKLHVNPSHLQQWLCMKEGQGNGVDPQEPFGGLPDPKICNRHSKLEPYTWVASIFMEPKNPSSGTQEQLNEYCSINLPESSAKAFSITFEQLLIGLRAYVTDALPWQVVKSAGLSFKRQLRLILLSILMFIALFAFFGFAASAFNGINSFTGSLIQSMLAIGSAIGFQSGISRDKESIRLDILEKMSKIFEADLSKVLAEPEIVKPEITSDIAAVSLRQAHTCLGIKYMFAAKTKSSPYLWLKVNRGETIDIEPEVSVIGATSWSCSSTDSLTHLGLNLDRTSGRITGKIRDAGKSEALLLRISATTPDAVVASAVIPFLIRR